MVHQYKLNGYNMVLDSWSGSVHSVDDVAYDIIALIQDHSDDEITSIILSSYPDKPDVTESDVRECIDDVHTLIQQGRLYSANTFFGRAQKLKVHDDQAIKALCLNVAHTCNLNCSYCFASQGRFHGERAMMSLEVGKRALDFLIEQSANRYYLEVDFFGGEPLMNWETVKELVRYARTLEATHNKRFRFTLTTNGILINDDVINFTNREMSNIVLSLDGRKEIHDRQRVDLSGRGSYGKVVPRFQKLVHARGGKDYYIRGTFTHANPDISNDIFHMASLGFSMLSMEPVVCDPSDPNVLTPQDIEIVKKEYEKLAVWLLDRKKAGHPVTFYHYMLDLENGPCIYKRMSGCGSGSEYMAVTPWGDLYPCHQFVGEERFRLGDIWKGVTNEPLRDEFRLLDAWERDECRDCWALIYCSGGCAANAWHATGSVRGVYTSGCELFKKRIECALMMKAAEENETL